MLREVSSQSYCGSMKTTDLDECKQKEKDEEDFVQDFDEDVHVSEKKTSYSMFAWFQSSNSRRVSETENCREDFATSREIEDFRKESLLAKTVRNIRNKFIDRNLQGKIFIHHMTGIFSSACTCEIGAADRKSYQVNEDLSDLSFQSKRALSMTDTILDSLERRSLAWDGVEFVREVLLTRGATLGIADPFFGVIGFSITLEISANVKTLLASRKRYDMEVQIAREEKERARVMREQELLQRTDSKRKGDLFFPRNILNLSFLASSTTEVSTTSAARKGTIEMSSNDPVNGDEGEEETKDEPREEGDRAGEDDPQRIRMKMRRDSDTVYCSGGSNVYMPGGGGGVAVKGCGWGF